MSDVLLRPHLDDADRDTRWELPAVGPERPTRRRALPRRALAGIALGAALVASAVADPPVELAQSGPVGFDADATHLTLERFDERGVYSLRYVHGDDAEVRIPVRNDGWLTTTLTGVSFGDRAAPMIEPAGTLAAPIELAPGEEAELVVPVRFDNCEYYTERAMDVYGDVTVATRTAGIGTSTRVTLDHALVVRSPMMTTCPDRVSDRGAFLRGG